MSHFNKPKKINGSSGRTRTYNPPVNSRKDATSFNCWQVLVAPENQCFVIFWFMSR
jgi:hypothetical protein